MDLLDSILAEPGMQLHMEMRVGDMQFINNFSVMHSRTAYIDGDTNKRHLVRLWFDDPNAKRRGVTVRDLYTGPVAGWATSAIRGDRGREQWRATS